MFPLHDEEVLRLVTVRLLGNVTSYSTAVSAEEWENCGANVVVRSLAPLFVVDNRITFRRRWIHVSVINRIPTAFRGATLVPKNRVFGTNF